LVKKAAAAKNIPLLALALFAAVFMVDQVVASVYNPTPTRWVIKASCTNPESPSCYEEDDGDITADCTGFTNVCGIVAPDDGGQPLIEEESQLYEDLLNGNYLSNPNIYTMP